ncbi:hypothetical protein [Mesorhizobium sp. WSM3873]|uniref:hypothetical protein n=1 Tax=Mesorhizobium sp. WSM3873 TaxID=1854056 RepID=UPI0007FEA3CA|nr:hypothetical protein [Mesorhizobium sp. WSM3873]OBQ77404.1 hypothetical protein A9K71_10275 [Mesorhizobium sp. WSM3873]
MNLAGFPAGEDELAEIVIATSLAIIAVFCVLCVLLFFGLAGSVHHPSFLEQESQKDEAARRLANALAPIVKQAVHEATTKAVRNTGATIGYGL